jgi:hypothetical protein
VFADSSEEPVIPPMTCEPNRMKLDESLQLPFFTGSASDRSIDARRVYMQASGIWLIRKVATNLWVSLQNLTFSHPSPHSTVKFNIDFSSCYRTTVSACPTCFYDVPLSSYTSDLRHHHSTSSASGPYRFRDILDK